MDLEKEVVQKMLVFNVVRLICKAIDEGFNGVAGMFFDFTKAFEMVDHDILLQKLSCYGIQGRELLPFKSYFENRKQYVEINNSKSIVGGVIYGVPQGCGLGPLLFSIYLNDTKNTRLWVNFTSLLMAFAYCIHTRMS